MNRIKYISISLHIISAALVYFFSYGITTSVFASKSPNKIFFTLSQIIGSFLGRILGLFLLPKVCSEFRLSSLLAVYLFSAIPIILFPVLPLVVQIAMVGLGAIPGNLIWGLMIFYIQGTSYTDVAIMVIYMFLIAGSGVAKSLGDWMLQNAINVNDMPTYCAILSLVAGVSSSVLLSSFPEPPEKEQKEAIPLSEQVKFLFQYSLGLIPISLTYGLLSAYRSFRNYYTVDILRDVLGDYNSSILSITEIISSIVVTLLFGLLFFISNQKLAFFLLLFAMLGGSFLIGFATFVYIYFPDWGLVWFTTVGIGVSIATIPPGALLYDKMGKVVERRFSTVALVYSSEICNSIGTFGIMGMKMWVIKGSFEEYFFYVSFIISIPCVILMGWTIMVFLIQMRVKTKEGEEENGSTPVEKTT